MGELGEERLKKTGRGTENKSKSYRDLEVVDRESSARKVNKTEEEDWWNYGQHHPSRQGFRWIWTTPPRWLTSLRSVGWTPAPPVRGRTQAVDSALWCLPSPPPLVPWDWCCVVPAATGPSPGWEGVCKKPRSVGVIGATLGLLSTCLSAINTQLYATDVFTALLSAYVTMKIIRQALPLPAMLTTVICVNYITIMTWQLLDQTLLRTFDTSTAFC